MLAAAATIRVTYTRPGPASTCARFLGLALEPFVHVLDVLWVAWFPNADFGLFIWTWSICTWHVQYYCCFGSRGVTITGTTAARCLQQSFCVPSSVQRWVWQYHLQHVLGHGPNVAVDGHIHAAKRVVGNAWTLFLWIFNENTVRMLLFHVPNRDVHHFRGEFDVDWFVQFELI